MACDPLMAVLDYLKDQHLVLTTAESCTAGCMVALLAACPGTGEVLESGYVVYSPSAKKRLLGVNPETIELYGLTQLVHYHARWGHERAPEGNGYGGP